MMDDQRIMDHESWIMADEAYLAEVREARENGYACCCAACGTGLAQDGCDMHVPGCPHAA